MGTLLVPHVLLLRYMWVYKHVVIPVWVAHWGRIWLCIYLAMQYSYQVHSEWDIPGRRGTWSAWRGCTYFKVQTSWEFWPPPHSLPPPPQKKKEEKKREFPIFFFEKTKPKLHMESQTFYFEKKNKKITKFCKHFTFWNFHVFFIIVIPNKMLGNVVGNLGFLSSSEGVHLIHGIAQLSFEWMDVQGVHL